MERHQAVALLKEIITLELAQPSAVYIRENKGKFELVMKVDCSPGLQNFIAKRGLMWRVRQDMGVCIIYKTRRIRSTHCTLHAMNGQRSVTDRTL